MDINDSRYLPSTNFFYSALVSQQRSSYLFFCFEIPKVFEEFWFWWKLWWFQEMKQAKQFLHSILQWCSCEQHFVLLEMENTEEW